MNRHLTLLTAVVMTILCVSCNKDDTKSDPFITITTPAGKNPTSITIEATAYSQDFTISSNASWRIDKPATANWLTVSPLEGTGDATIKVSAAANEQTSRLQAMLTFYSGDTKLHTLTIIQNPAAAYLNVDPAQPDTIPADGGDVVLTVSTNAGAWDAEITGENSGWLTEKERTETSITFTAAKSTSSTESTAKVTFSLTSDPNVTQEVEIVQQAQNAAFLVIEPETPANIPMGGGDLTLNINTNITDWDAAISGENSGWLTEKERTETSITFTAAANPDEVEQTATVTFTSKEYPEIEESVTIKQNAKEAIYMDLTPEAPYEISMEGGNLKLVVGTNASGWDAVISGDNSTWLSEKERTETSITFTADANLTPDLHEATVTFTTPADDPDFEQVITISQNGLIADLLDVQFLEDGTGIDISPMQRAVETFKGPNFSTVYLESYKRYAGRFAPAELSTSISDGFLKIDYKGDETYKSALADGHTMEMLIMLNSDLKIGSEVKMFSSMQGGGTGFLLSKETNEFTFLPNIGGWKWCYSGVVPQKGVYYHVVGVWNKDAGKAYIYIDGELKGEADASGDFSFPSTDACHWFCIGGDPSSETGTENCWIGDIGIARIYDKALSDKQVAALYDRINE